MTHPKSQNTGAGRGRPAEQPASASKLTSGGLQHGGGVLPSQHLQALIEEGSIHAPVSIEPGQVQPASLDLRLGPTGYRIRASFLPGSQGTVTAKLEHLTTHTVDLTQPAILERGCVYLVPLQEELRLPAGVGGAANPKSSIGRLDIFTRLLTEYGDLFDTVPDGYEGKLYLEIVPRTFSIRVRQGDRLNQLRLFRGGDRAHSDQLLAELHREEEIVFASDHGATDPLISEGLWLGVDLRGEGESPIIGYRAKRHSPPVDLAKIRHYPVFDFWEPVTPSRTGQLVLNPEDFYILVSKQRIRIPLNYAADMVAFDPTVGEFRVHYAGFFDPGFGYGGTQSRGTPAVLEVRSHEVPFLIEDGQIVGRLRYKKLLEPSTRGYGDELGSSYNDQRLTLSKHFKSE